VPPSMTWSPFMVMMRAFVRAIVPVGCGSLATKPRCEIAGVGQR